MWFWFWWFWCFLSFFFFLFEQLLKRAFVDIYFTFKTTRYLASIWMRRENYRKIPLVCISGSGIFIIYTYHLTIVPIKERVECVFLQPCYTLFYLKKMFYKMRMYKLMCCKWYTLSHTQPCVKQPPMGENIIGLHSQICGHFHSHGKVFWIQNFRTTVFCFFQARLSF